jgi:hypothetical protein
MLDKGADRTPRKIVSSTAYLRAFVCIFLLFAFQTFLRVPANRWLPKY